MREGLWSGRVAGLVGRRRSLAGGAGLSTTPVGVPLSTCAWPAGPGDSRRPPQVVRGLREWPGAGVKQGVNEGGSSW